MARTIVALYDDMGTARKVVDELVKNGISRTAISLAANDSGGEFKKLSEGVDSQHVDAGEGSAFGAAVGALTGILVSLGALVIPGVGPVLAAGPLAAALAGGVTGAVAGAATGGIVGGLLSLDIPEADAHAYAEGVRRGGVLLAVEPSETQADWVAQIMDQYKPVDVDQRVNYWKQNGWKNFDESGSPFPTQDISRERESYQKYASQSSTTPGSTNSRVRSYDRGNRPSRV
jgi:hypothetical protein